MSQNNENEVLENVDVVENETVTTVKIADDVVSVIAAKAAGEVDGVAGMTGTRAGELAEKLGVKSLSKGIKVEITEANVAVSLNILIEYGYKIQEVCKEVQTVVKNAVESMTGLGVTEVNIYVQAIVFPQPEELPEAAVEAVTEE